jgi:hypothetical protein
LGYWAISLLKMPFEVVWMVFFLCCVFFVPSSLFLHAPGCGVALSSPEPRAFGKHLRYSLRGKFRNSRFALRHLNFLSPALRSSSPGLESVAIGLRHSRSLVVGWGFAPQGSQKFGQPLLFCQSLRQWSAATFGVPMTNNKGPLGTLGMGMPCGAV